MNHHCYGCRRWKRGSEFPRNPYTLTVAAICLTCRLDRLRVMRRKREARRDPMRLPAEPLQQVIRTMGVVPAARQIGVTADAVRHFMQRQEVQLATADRWATELGMPLSLIYGEAY